MFIYIIYLYFQIFKTICSNETNNDYILKFVVNEKCLNDDCHYENEIELIKDKLNNVKNVIFQHDYNSKLLGDIESINNYEIIFYRKNIPILFDASVFSIDGINEWLEYNKESKVVQLDDDNFEHLTQSATGSTTGDWIVLFYKGDCFHFQPIWEALASNLNQRVLIASINMSQNIQVVQRFTIVECPTIKYLRHGKIYDYNMQSYSLSKLTSFVNGWYTNFPSRKVPPLPSPFDLLTDGIANWLKDNVPYEVLIFLILSLIILGSLLLFQMFRPKISEDLKEE